MDKDALVDQITRQVLAALDASQPSGGAPRSFSNASSGGRDLILFTGNVDELKRLTDARGEIAPTRAILVLPRDSEVRRDHAERLGFSRVVFMDEGQRPVDLVADCSRVIIPLYNYQQLADLAGLCDSCWDVRLALKALAEGRKVALWTAEMAVAAPFRQKVEAYLGEIAGYGIEIMNRPATALPPSASSTVLAAPPRGTVLHAEPAVSLRPPNGAAHDSPCQLKAVGECAGLGQCAKHLPERVGIIIEHGADRLSAAPGVGRLGSDVGRYIDHTLLKPDATREQVVQLCQEARQYEFASVCVNPAFVHLAADALRGSNVKVCTVVGFPLGANTTVTKAMETRDAVANGADEIDMVINVGALKARNDDLVRHDIEAVVEAADGRIVKVILETALLTDEEKVRASKLSHEAGADFVKTSTGFGPGGATAHDIALMRQTVGRYMGVKASGGIKDLQVAQEMLAAGATRIGASASVKIVKGESGGPTGGKQAY